MIRLSAAKVDEAIKSPIAAFRWSSGSGLEKPQKPNTNVAFQDLIII
jgi:hypothetical protein